MNQNLPVIKLLPGSVHTGDTNQHLFQTASYIASVVKEYNSCWTRRIMTDKHTSEKEISDKIKTVFFQEMRWPLINQRSSSFWAFLVVYQDYFCLLLSANFHHFLCILAMFNHLGSRILQHFDVSSCICCLLHRAWFSAAVGSCKHRS